VFLGGAGAYRHVRESLLQRTEDVLAKAEAAAQILMGRQDALDDIHTLETGLTPRSHRPILDLLVMIHGSHFALNRLTSVQ
jgi:hypothetical protein